MAKFFLRDQGGLMANLNKYINAVKKRERIPILRVGATEVRNYVRIASTTPKSKKNHWYYKKTGSYIDRTTTRIPIYSGNLRKSIRMYKDRNDDFQVGPHFLRSIKADQIGKTVYTASGYYAAALYGTASQFRQKVMEPAVEAARKKAVEIGRAHV